MNQPIFNLKSTDLCKQYIILFICLQLGNSLFGQPILPIVSKGNRPKINLERIPTTAYRANNLNLKFQPRFRNNLYHFNNDAWGNLIFGIPKVDSLNKKYHLNKSNALFGCIMQDGELYAKHQAWGLDLWFNVAFNGNIDVKEVMKAYQLTGAFDVVEPVYKASIQGNPPLPNTPNDPSFYLQWNLNNTGQSNGTSGKDISMLNAWGISTGDPSVLVSVHDNAININNADISQNIAPSLSHNFLANTDSLTLNTSHGTHCAGIIAEVRNNGIGMSGIAGGDGTANSGIRLVSCETFGPHDTSGGFAESFIYAADHGVAISSNSWGYDEPYVYEEAVLDAIDYFCDNGGGGVLNGGIVVFAGGNNGKNWRIYPGGYERVISVAATNNQDRRSTYSNYGNWISLSAPGGEGYMGGGIYGLDNFGYSSSPGTSYSGPHVAGVAALVASVLKGKASANDVREIILSTTDNNYPENPSYLKMLGTGRLNAYTALKKAQSLASKRSNTISNFTANFQCEYIKVNWTNPQNSNVVVVYNNNSNIGSLVDGTTYNVSDTLMGGGVVVYKGNGNSLNFPISEGENQYSFKIWVSSTDNKYSFSKIAECFAKPIIRQIGDSAMKQSFNYPPLFPTKLWHGTNTKYDFSSWIHTANDTSSTGAGDDYSMCLYNYQYNKQLGAVDTFTSPQLWVKGADNITLTFFHAYQYVPNLLPYSDSLEVLVSNDCGNTYTSVWRKGGKDLATVSDTAHQKFYPFGGLSKWKQDTINLSTFKSSDKIVIGFRGYNGKGNNLFLDNINVALHYQIDATISKVYLPSDSACSSSSIADAIIKNVGINTIKSCNVGYQLDNNEVKFVQLTHNLTAGDSTNLNLSFQASVGVHSLKVFSSLPNNGIDNNTTNDTLTTTITVLPKDTLPFIENFEDSLLNNTGWQTAQQAGNNFSWLHANFASSNGKGSAYAQNFAYNNYGFYQDLISPTININHQIDSLFLLFDVAAAIQADSINTPRIDTLQIDFTKDCGLTWTTIYKKWGDSLQTTAPTYQDFVPTANQWRRDSISVAGITAGGNQIRFRFRDIENGSNNIYIDNIQVYAKTLPSPLQEKGLLVYPNPFKNNLTIQHYVIPTNLQNVIVVDSRGRKVKEINYNGLASTTQLVSLNNLEAGFYTLELIYSDKKVVKKLIKMDK